MALKSLRNQRRDKERNAEEASNRANAVFQKLCDIYHNVFIYNNPDSVEVTTVYDDMATKWLMYCKTNKVMPEHHDIFERYAKTLRADYDQNKAEVLAKKSGEGKTEAIVENILERTSDVNSEKRVERLETNEAMRGMDVYAMTGITESNENNSD